MYDNSASTESQTSSGTASSSSYGNYGGEALTGAGGLTSAFSTYMAGRYQDRIARINKDLAKQQAAQAIQAGQFAANRVAIREQQIEGRQTAMAGSGNTLAGAGSNAAARASSQTNSAMDQYMIQLNARREAFGFQVRAQAASQAGKMAEQTADNQAVATLMNTGSQEFLESDSNYGGYRGRGIQF